MKEIKVNEIFGPTVQGEGKNSGKPVMFLRLAMCNLHCIWCDTPYTWNWTGTDFANPEKFDEKKEVHPMLVHDVLSTLYKLGGGDIKSLVVSGGEPLLQWKALVPLFEKLQSDGWFIEVETNGTSPLNPAFVAVVDQFNCSPKLSNSLDPEKLRIHPKTLSALAREPKVNFKFVVSDDKDIPEILHLVKEHGMKEVRLMPLCQTREELEMRKDMVERLCKEHGFIYTSRLSIELSGTKRGI